MELKVQLRTKEENADTLRQNKFVPGVVYGKGIDSVSIKLPYDIFERAYAEGGESTIFDLLIEGEKEKRPVLIYDISRDIVKDNFTHVDFYQVRMDETITTEVPLVFVGESPIVVSMDGVLVKNLHQLEIEALPKNLPHEIKVDISVLEKVDDRITIGNLKLPDGVTATANPEEIIVTIIPARAEEVQTAAAELEEAEVVGKDKEAKEGEESAEE